MPLLRSTEPVKFEIVPLKPWLIQGPAATDCTETVSRRVDGWSENATAPVWFSPPNGELAPPEFLAWMPMELTSNWSVGVANAGAHTHSAVTTADARTDFILRTSLLS